MSKIWICFMYWRSQGMFWGHIFKNPPNFLLRLTFQEPRSWKLMIFPIVFHPYCIMEKNVTPLVLWISSCGLFSSIAGKSHFKTNPNKIKCIKNFLPFEIKLEDDILKRKSIYLDFIKLNNSLECTLKVVDFISLNLNHHNCLRMPIKRWIIHLKEDY